MKHPTPPQRPARRSRPPVVRPPSTATPALLSPRGAIRTLARGTGWIDRLAQHLLPYDTTHADTPEQRARPIILVGIGLMIFLFGIVGLWSALWPLATGAIAPGRVMSESNSKTIQHLEGGIVKEILVREGEKVAAGQVLIRLENVSAEARNDQVRNQYVAAKAAEARLIAERDGAASIAFDPSLTAREASDPKIKEALDSQRRLFSTRKAALDGQLSVLQQKIAQSDEEVKGLREQASAASQQIELLRQETASVEELLKTGNATKPRLLALQRQQAQLIGQRGQAVAMASRAAQGGQEAKITMQNVKNQALNDAVKELKDTQTQLSSLEEQWRASADIVRRVDITAPMAGTVTGLAVHTVGGVIQPGATVMSLVPADDRLIVEVQVSPEDIDIVHADLPAHVRITALKSRYRSPLKGTVTTVSADRFDDPHTGQSFYLARIEIPQEELGKLGTMPLTPGMGAEALIVTGSRTMLSYLVQPIRDSFGHAFHDQ